MTDSQDPQPHQPPTGQPPTRRAAREAEKASGAADNTTIMPSALAADATQLLSAPAAASTSTVASTSAAASAATSLEAGRRAASAGLFASIAKHPNAWLFSALGVAFVLLATGSIFAGVAVGSPASASVVVSTPSPTVAPPRPMPAALVAPTHLRTCSVAALAADPNLLTFQASVINATTGEVLFDRSGAKPSRTASVLKTLTAAAALSVLGPDYQFSTRVYEGSTPGSVVLVGGGDPTLSALGSGQESVYVGAPQLGDLAAQVQAKWHLIHPDPSVAGGKLTDLVLDSTMWDPNDNWDPSWERSEQTEGYQPEVTALMVDGSRANPKSQDSPRSNDPVGDAGKAFAADLGLGGGGTVTTGSAVAGKQLLGEVKSRPIAALIAYMLPNSDNTLAEMLARVTSKVAGSDGSSASLATVIPAALQKYGLTTAGLVIKDGSGLSDNNAVPATFVAQLMARVLGGKGNLNIIYDALPIAGKSGTLAGRFTGPNAVARGAVNAKTGWIKTEYSLAGIVHATDGASLAFAFYALGAINKSTQPALDTITTGIFGCGNNLSNN